MNSAGSNSSGQPILDPLGPTLEDRGTAPDVSPSGPKAPERGPLRVRVYVDGFNLYFGCLQNTPYRWLDIPALATHLLDPVLSSYELTHVRYFTAPVKPLPNDPDAPNRQRAYLTALGTLANVTIHRGTFKTKTKTYPLANGGGFVDVLVSEEKGSDVNLASYLLLDAIDGAFDVALVVSNDTDLIEPIKIARSRFPVQVGISAPCFFRNRRPHGDLVRVADFSAHILAANKSCLQACQLPETIALPSGGTISRPSRWR